MFEGCLYIALRMLEKCVYTVGNFLFPVSLCLNTLDVFHLTLVFNEQGLYIQLHFCIVQKNKTLHKV